MRSGSRFYIELRSPTEQYSLQALSESAMTHWADAINAAVAAAFGTASAAGQPARGAAAEASGAAPHGNAALAALVASGARCADCGAARPEWASINLCVPLCLECAGCHRSMGSHVSKVHRDHDLLSISATFTYDGGHFSQVRSLVLDSWEPGLIAMFSAMQRAGLGGGGGGGPDVAAPLTGPNAVWCAAVPPAVRVPTDSTDAAAGPGPREHREVFIRLKYELREFLDAESKAQLAESRASKPAPGGEPPAPSEDAPGPLDEAMWAGARSLPCTFPVPSLYLPCTFPVPSRRGAGARSRFTQYLGEFYI